MAKRSQLKRQFLLADFALGVDEYERNREAVSQFYIAFKAFIDVVGIDRASLYGMEIASSFAKIGRVHRRSKLADPRFYPRAPQDSPEALASIPLRRPGRGGMPGPRNGKARTATILMVVVGLAQKGWTLGEIVRGLHENVPEFRRIDLASVRRRVQRAMREHGIS